MHIFLHLFQFIIELFINKWFLDVDWHLIRNLDWDLYNFLFLDWFLYVYWSIYVNWFL